MYVGIRHNLIHNILKITSSWDRPHILYGQLLDWIRWLVAWQPLILFLAQGINWVFGLEWDEDNDEQWRYVVYVDESAEYDL